VLDVGTGSGALGKILSTQADCVVDGLTYNEEEAQLARPHYRRLLVLDLERDPLQGCFAPEQYDVIVCADVLEHLRNAQQVLRTLSHFLKPNGVVLLSLPNVTHLGVILGLMAGRFVRTREGLLDSTHVHFMDREALLNLVHGAGFGVSKEDSVRRNLADTEFSRLNYQVLPQVVRTYLQSLPDSDIYQFIWTLRPEPQGGQQNAISSEPPARPVIAQQPRFIAQLFLDQGAGFSATHCVDAFGVQVEGMQTLQFHVPDHENVQALRLDFSDRPGQLEFESLIALDADGNELWVWRGDWAHNQTYHQCDWTGVRGWFGGRIVRSTGDDPWVCIPVDVDQWRATKYVNLRMTSAQPVGATDWPALNVEHLQAKLCAMSASLDGLVGQLMQKVAKLESSTSLLQSELAATQSELAATQSELAATQSELASTQSELASTRTAADIIASQLNSVQASASWRITGPLRWLKRELSRLRNMVTK
jgi:2-polyprenyl-3-methyl-5-hydroxy-6-metoxy-1,4-benzoquinol methylase